jgi:hypothetical protein
MPYGKGTYGSKVGRPKKNLHTDPPRGGRSIPKVTPKRAGGKVTSSVKKTTGGGQPVRKAKAPVRVKRTTARRTSRK